MSAIDFHIDSKENCCRRLKSDASRGLSEEEAQRRLHDVGPNRMAEPPRIRPLHIFLKQFSDFMVLVLMGAGAISFFLGESLDALAIGAILLLNAVFGFVQEFRAEQSLQALQQLTAPRATVIRDGERQQIAAEAIVPGDILLVESGDRVPADGRLLWSMALEVDQSPFTGESVPVPKSAEHIGTPDEEVAERRNMVYMGTAVTRGRARVLVTATGMTTEIGEIAALIQSSQDEATPLQQRLQQLGKWLVAACALLVFAVFAGGVWRGLPVYDMFLTGVSLAVAAIPEGLPAVVTASLALGVRRMIRRNAIVRRLPTVETLGCATVICTDKTGTLTRNEMTVTRIYVGNREVEVSGTGYRPEGGFLSGGERIRPESLGDLMAALRISVLCNSAELVPDRRGGRRGRERAWQVLGDPTEGALLVAGMKAGLDRSRILRQTPVELEHPFDPARRRMSVIVRQENGYAALVKGAPAAILDRCTHYRVDGTVLRMTESLREQLHWQTTHYAEQALRVLALAERPVSDASAAMEECEQGLTFVGLVAMFDPPRDEVRKAILRSHRAGIRTIMLTGDHPATAVAVGRMIHLLGPHDRAITGRELDGMDSAALQAALATTRCFARVSPKHKLRVVQALREQGEVVAMTGDGVNDAPAVKEADIGICMGKTGSDVTKEASSLVLSDDNYATIVAAVEEGRGIYENIRKFIRYLLGCNAGEVFAMLFAVLMGIPLPLLPMQILWMNLVTDGLPALALGIDPPDEDVMRRPPRPPKEGIFSRRLHWKIVYSGFMIGGSALLAFLVALQLRPDALDWARTIAFTTLVTSQLIFAFTCRSEHRSPVEAGLFANRYLVGAVGVSFVMQLAAIYWSPVAAIFRTEPLSFGDWGWVFLFSAWGVLLGGVVNAFRRRAQRRFALLRVALRRT